MLSQIQWKFLPFPDLLEWGGISSALFPNFYVILIFTIHNIWKRLLISLFRLLIKDICDKIIEDFHNKSIYVNSNIIKRSLCLFRFKLKARYNFFLNSEIKGIFLLIIQTYLKLISINNIFRFCHFYLYKLGLQHL